MAKKSPDKTAPPTPPPGSGPALLKAAIEAKDETHAAAAVALGIGKSTISDWLDDAPKRIRRPKDHHRTLIELRYGVSRYAWENMKERGERLATLEEYQRAS